MRKIIYLLILVILISGCTTFYNTRRSQDIVIKVPAPQLPEYEKLTYQISWLGLPVGTITSSIEGIKKIDGRDAYILEVVAQTNDFCSAIYRIDDRFVSYMDVEHLYTLRHEVYRREGRFKKDAITDFDQVNHKAYFRNLLDKSEKVIDISPMVQDTLSACYYFMILPVAVGDRVEYAVYNNEDNYQLFGLIQSKGFIWVPTLGKREAFYIQPYAQLEGEEVKKGKLSGYFSCDKRRIPLLAVVEAPMFTKITASLYKIEYR